MLTLTGVMRLLMDRLLVLGVPNVPDPRPSDRAADTELRRVGLALDKQIDRSP